jgi:hypothetical protein
MTDCPNVRMRDALPDLLHDRLTPGVRAECMAHVAGCADCAAELALLRSARAALGRVPAVDAAAIVRALPVARVPVAALPPSMRPSAWRGAARWRVAAGVVLVAGGAWLAALRDGGRAADDGAATVATGSRVAAPGGAASGVSAGGTLASGAAEPARRPSVASGLGVSVADLSDEELEAVFREMDEVDALPSVDPLPTMTPIGVEGDA